MKFSGLKLLGLRDISIEIFILGTYYQYHFRTIQDHAWTIIEPWFAQIYSQRCLDMSLEYLIFGPCQDHVQTMMRPWLSQLYFKAIKNFKTIKTLLIWSESYIYGVPIFWTIQGQCWANFRAMFMMFDFTNNSSCVISELSPIRIGYIYYSLTQIQGHETCNVMFRLFYLRQVISNHQHLESYLMPIWSQL